MVVTLLGIVTDVILALEKAYAPYNDNNDDDYYG
jgi:hypothetical protein